MKELPSVMRFKKQWLEDWFYGLDTLVFQGWLLVSLFVNKRDFWAWSTSVFTLVSFVYYWVLVRYIRSFKLVVRENGNFVVRWRIGFQRVATIERVRGYRAKHRFLWLYASIRIGFWFKGHLYLVHRKQTILIPIVYKKSVWDLFATNYQCERARRLLEEMIQKENERRCG